MIGISPWHGCGSMILPEFLRAALSRWARWYMASHGPDQVLRTDGTTDYLKRWYIVRKSKEWGRFGFNIYIHEILRPDDDRALHDHPWNFTSIILEGGYREVIGDSFGQPLVTLLRKEGQIIRRKATDAHRLILHLGDPRASRGDSGAAMKYHPALTLIICGRNRRHWGFWAEQGIWIHWRKFI